MEEFGFYGRDDELEGLLETWQRVVTQQQPEVVVLLAESGLGKTRIVQEFYHRLAEASRSADGHGYWPSTLGRRGQNLQVNPAPEALDASYVPPFLWWGLRLTDPEERNQLLGSVLSTAALELEVHLQGLRRAQQVKAALMDAGQLVAGQLIGAVPVVGPAIGVVQTALGMWKEARTVAAAQQAPVEVVQRTQDDLTHVIFRDLQALNDRARRSLIPMVWFIDDAQFSKDDVTVTDLVRTVLKAAGAQQWPLLLLITSWEREWHEGSNVQPDEPRTIALEVSRYHSARCVPWKPTSLGRMSFGSLAPLLRDTLPGLTPEQTDAILQRVDGNPLFLSELIRYAQANPGFFVKRDLMQAMSPSGLRQILASSTSLVNVIEERFRAVPGDVQEVVALAGLQGMRSLNLITTAMLSELRHHQPCQCFQPIVALNQAERPHALLVHSSAGVTEFQQRVSQEVAARNLSNLFDDQIVQDVYIQVLSTFDLSSLSSTLKSDELDLLLALTGQNLRHNLKLSLRQQAMLAYGMLCVRAYRNYDFETGMAAATVLMETFRQGPEALDLLSIGLLNSVIMLLHDMFDTEAVHELSSYGIDRANAESNQYWEAQMLGRRGVCEASLGLLEQAQASLQRSLMMAEELHAEENTHRTRHLLAYALYRRAFYAPDSPSEGLGWLTKSVQLVAQQTGDLEADEVWLYVAFMLQKARLQYKLTQFEPAWITLMQVEAYLNDREGRFSPQRFKITQAELVSARAEWYNAQERRDTEVKVRWEAIECVRAVEKVHASVADMNYLAQLLIDQGLALSKGVGDPAGLEPILEAQALVAKLRERAPARAVHKINLDMLQAQAAILADGGQLTDAIAVMQEAVRTQQERAALPGYLHGQIGYATSLQYLGGMKYEAGWKDEGIANLNEALTWMRGVADKYPSLENDIRVAQVLLDLHNYCDQPLNQSDRAGYRRDCLSLYRSREFELTSRYDHSQFLSLLHAEANAAREAGDRNAAKYYRQWSEAARRAHQIFPLDRFIYQEAEGLHEASIELAKLNMIDSSKEANSRAIKLLRTGFMHPEEPRTVQLLAEASAHANYLTTYRSVSHRKRRWF